MTRTSSGIRGVVSAVSQNLAPSLLRITGRAVARRTAALGVPRTVRRTLRRPTAGAASRSAMRRELPDAVGRAPVSMARSAEATP